jgi:aminoglycoside 6'-N-acetyltransferase
MRRVCPAYRPGVIQTGRAVLRDVVDTDFPTLADHVRHPSVAQWWPRYDEERLRREVPDQPCATVVVDGHVAGYVQWDEEEEPDYRHASIDIFLGPGFQDLGLGREVLTALATWLVDVRGHHRITIDPAADNARAIRSYAAVGFRPVGLLRRYERGADGTWHDGLLMDLLAEELVRAPAG